MQEVLSCEAKGSRRVCGTDSCCRVDRACAVSSTSL